MLIKNSGLIQEPINPRSWVLGANSPIEHDETNPSGNWEKYLPVTEKQRFKQLDTWACVSFSALNSIEILQKCLTGMEDNYSDRALANMSGTIAGRGNTLAAVADTVRLNGICDEQLWPYGNDSAEKYYSVVSQNIIDECKKTVGLYNHEWVHFRNWPKALKNSPLQVTVNAWLKGPTYYENSEDEQNHAVVLIGYKPEKYWTIFDSYEPYIKQLGWNYKFGIFAMAYHFNNKIKKNMEVRNNYLYKLVQGESGKLGLGLDGRLVVNISEADKFNVFLEAIARNGGSLIGKIISVMLEDWNSVPHITLKGEKTD